MGRLRLPINSPGKTADGVAQLVAGLGQVDARQGAQAAPVFEALGQHGHPFGRAVIEKTMERCRSRGRRLDLQGRSGLLPL